MGDRGSRVLRGQQKTKLVRNAQRALSLRKQAAAVAPVLGQDVTTPLAYLQELWDLQGDGRTLVDGQTRTLLLLQCLSQYTSRTEAHLRSSVATANLLASFVARYAGLPGFDQALEPAFLQGGALVREQREVMDILASYVQALSQQGLVEPGSAARILRESGVAASVQAEEALFQIPAVHQWLTSSGAAIPDPAGVERSSRPVDLRFTFTTGETSLVRALREEVLGIVEDLGVSGKPLRILVFSSDPLHLFRALAPILLDVGIPCACQASMPFSQTLLGCALMDTLSLRREEGDWRDRLTDLAYLPLLGSTPSAAQILNSCMRQDALMEEEVARGLLAQESPVFQQLWAFVEAPGLKAAAALREAIQEAEAIPFGYREQEMAALSALEGLCEKAAAYGAEEEILELLTRLRVSVPQATTTVRKGGPLVEIRGNDALDAVAPGCADAVIFCDASKDAFALPLAKPATTSLLSALGIEDDSDAHEELRAAFSSALAAARERIVLLTPERNSSGTQQYPSFLFEELVEEMSEGAQWDVDPEGIFRIPEACKDSLKVIDERDVLQGFGRTFTEPEKVLAFQRPVQGQLQELSMGSFIPKSASCPAAPLLSASQIELYADCPYKWFITRKVGIETLDEALDAQAVGSFAHRVFQRTFDELASKGIRQVSTQNVEEVQAVAERIFDELLAVQADLPPGERCPVRTTEESARFEELKQSILRAFGFMEQLPEGFYVQGEEVALSDEDSLFYAGAVLRGSVDRVDVDPNGAYAVLDYKGSVGDHEAGRGGEDEAVLPRKIQALIYAKALKGLPRFADMACVGAIYLSYRAATEKKAVAGSFDALHYDASKLTDNGASVVDGNFDAFLQSVEDLVAPYVARMQAGDIAPDPRLGACRYCPLTFCRTRVAV